MRFVLDTAASPETSALLLKHLGKHPVPWKAEASSIVDARGVVFMVMDGGGCEERWALAQLLVLVVNGVRL